MTTHLVIPDTQVKPGLDFSHLEHAGKYAAEKKPDVIVMLGDFADMASLSSYDVGKKIFEGRSYTADVDAAKEAMGILMAPIRKEQERLRRNKDKQWKPRLVLTLGNHEQRINTAINNDRKLDGLISIDDLGYKEHGWEVIPFLETINIDGIIYSHYFVSGGMGRPVCSARALITKKHQSCIAGHQQGKDIAYDRRADGSRITCVIAGSFYQHQEAYLGLQGNRHWRGVLMLHEVNNGEFDEMWVSMNYFKIKYGN